MLTGKTRKMMGMSGLRKHRGCGDDMLLIILEKHIRPECTNILAMKHYLWAI